MSTLNVSISQLMIVDKLNPSGWCLEAKIKYID